MYIYIYTYPEIHNATVMSIVPIMNHSSFLIGPICWSFSLAKVGAFGVRLSLGGKSV